MGAASSSAHTHGLVRGGTQRQQPGCAAIDQVTHLIRQPRQLGPEVLIDPGPFPYLNDQRMIEADETKRLWVGPQRGGEHQRVSAIVFRARRREAIPKPIQLLRIDRIDGKPALHEPFDQRAARHLDPNCDRVRVAVGPIAQGIHEGLQGGRRVRYLAASRTWPSRSTTQTSWASEAQSIPTNQ